jgi:hypothetical protein
VAISRNAAASLKTNLWSSSESDDSLRRNPIPHHVTHPTEPQLTETLEVPRHLHSTSKRRQRYVRLKHSLRPQPFPGPCSHKHAAKSLNPGLQIALECSLLNRRGCRSIGPATPTLSSPRIMHLQAHRRSFPPHTACLPSSQPTSR